ncbi:MAG TPA: response regulator, partial [Acidimicrobiales bacterium]|nr:response regulator [Acidimicrobiales bacterium]
MIRVLIVDDAAVVRHILKDVIDAEDDMVVVGAAANGQAGLTMMHELTPDAVVMDIEMPVMTGLEALTVLREEGNKIPVIVFSTVTDRGAEATIDALALGARDYVTKPSKVGNFVEGVAQVREELLSRIRMFVGEHDRALARRAQRPPSAPAAPTTDAAASPPADGPRGERSSDAPPAAGSVRPATPAPAPRPAPVAPPAVSRPRRAPGSRIEILAIASSTGGPGALEEVLCGL